MKKIKLLIIGLILLFGLTNLKAQTLLPKLQNLFGAENVITVDSSAYKEFYKIKVTQLIDHNDESKGTFKQEVLLGYNDVSAPTVMLIHGYWIFSGFDDPSYKHELTELFNANQIEVEHRYFGQSVPENSDFSFLNFNQASADYHDIRQKLGTIFPDKWIATGGSKGGDATLAYKFCYPKDVNASVIYAISMSLEAEDKRYAKFFAEKKKTEEYKKIYQDQIYFLKNKKRLLPFFEELVKFKKFNFDEFDAETIYDYCVLEYEFYFWQYFGNYKELTESLDLLKNYVYTDGGFKTDFQLGKQDELVYYLGIIAKDFLDKRYQPHFYQAFTQGGYYGYDEKPFKKYLKHKNYSLSVFARQKVKFDNTFRKAQKKFAETEMERVIVINAETDPFSICTIPFPPDKDNLNLVLKNSTHTVLLSDFDQETQLKVKQKLTEWLNKSSH